MPSSRRVLTMKRHAIAGLAAAVGFAMVVVGGAQAGAKPMPTAPTTTTVEWESPAPAAAAAAPAPVPAQILTTTTLLPTTTAAPTTAPPTTSAPVTEPPTTQAPASSTTVSPPPADAPPPVDPAATAQGDAGPAADAPRLSDAAVADAIDSLQRSGASSTRALIEALASLSRFGLSPTDAAIKGFGKFPVAGLATWTDSWGDPRSNPTPHTHQGNDVFAAFGTPVRAPSDGTVRYGEDPTSGKYADVTEPNGTYYFMCHLEGYAPDLQSGDSVTQGQIVGFNGDTGNAKGGPPHVHFEVHPGGGSAVDPKPTLDRWLADALAAAPALVASYETDTPVPQVLISTGELRRFDIAAPGASGPALFLRLAEAAEEHSARERSMAALMPVTPRVLAPLLREPSA